MKTLLALSLLMERPLLLIGGPLVLLFVVLGPFLMSSNDADILWREALVVPAYLGCVLGIMTGELKATFSSWMLPVMRQRFTVVLAIVLFLVMLLSGALHANFGSDAARGAVIAGLSFTTLLNVSQGQARRLTIAVALVLTTAFLRPGVIALLDPVSAVVFVAALPAVVLWFVSAQLSPELHRRRVLARENRFADPPRWLVFFLGEARRPLKVAASPTAAAWFRASFMATQRSIGSWVVFQIGGGLLTGTVIYGLGDPSIAGTMVLISGLSASWIGIEEGYAFPISRRTRADLRFCWNLFDAVRIAITVAAMTALFYAVDPLPSLADPTSSISMGASVVMAFIWLPVAQWGNSAPPVRRMVDLQTSFGKRHILSLAAMLAGYMLTLVSYRTWARDLDSAPKVALFVTLCVLMYGGSLFFLRRAYATRDLV